MSVEHYEVWNVVSENKTKGKQKHRRADADRDESRRRQRVREKLASVFNLYVCTTGPGAPSLTACANLLRCLRGHVEKHSNFYTSSAYQQIRQKLSQAYHW